MTTIKISREEGDELQEVLDAAILQEGLNRDCKLELLKLSSQSIFRTLRDESKPYAIATELYKNIRIFLNKLDMEGKPGLHRLNNFLIEHGYPPKEVQLEEMIRRIVAAEIKKGVEEGLKKLELDVAQIKALVLAKPESVPIPNGNRKKGNGSEEGPRHLELETAKTKRSYNLNVPSDSDSDLETNSILNEESVTGARNSKGPDPTVATSDSNDDLPLGNKKGANSPAGSSGSDSDEGGAIPLKNPASTSAVNPGSGVKNVIPQKNYIRPSAVKSGSGSNVPIPPKGTPNAIAASDSDGDSKNEAELTPRSRRNKKFRMCGYGLIILATDSDSEDDAVVPSGRKQDQGGSGNDLGIFSSKKAGN